MSESVLCQTQVADVHVILVCYRPDTNSPELPLPSECARPSTGESWRVVTKWPEPARRIQYSRAFAKLALAQEFFDERVRVLSYGQKLFEP